MRKGRHSEASKFLRRCVDITHEMAHELIEQCRAINVDCIVAPYEADGQLAYLNKIGLADYVITEDSDLTLFGCSKILFKLDLTGACVLVESDKFHLAMNCTLDKFTMEKFRLMCVLSGCDYTDSLPGIGLAKACKFVMMTEETNLWRALDKIPAYLNMRQLTVTDEYKENVHKALATFMHMVVYDPRQRRQVRLNDIEEIGTEPQYCSNSGDFLDDGPSLELAVGNLNPFTMARLGDWHPDKRQTVIFSIFKKVAAQIGGLIGRKLIFSMGRLNALKIPFKTSSKLKNFYIQKPTIDVKAMKVAKHPSIWQQDYRWNVSLTKQPKSDTQKVFDTTAVRRSKRSLPPQSAAELDDDANQSVERSEDIMSQYACLAAPEQKRFKDDTVEPTAEPPLLKSPPTPKRNPFKTSNPCTDELLSPTRISKENNSLVRNQSPVKRIDFNKIRKLSRFDRTTGAASQQTLSHFFAAGKGPPALLSPTMSNGLSAKSSITSPGHDDTEGAAPLYFHTESKVKVAADEIECVEKEVVPASVAADACNVLNNFMFASKNRVDSDDSAVCFSQTSSVTVQSNAASDGDESDSMAAEVADAQIEMISDSSNERNESADTAIEISDEEASSGRSLTESAPVAFKTKASQPISKPMEKKKAVSWTAKLL